MALKSLAHLRFPLSKAGSAVTSLGSFPDPLGQVVPSAGCTRESLGKLKDLLLPGPGLTDLECSLGRYKAPGDASAHLGGQPPSQGGPGTQHTLETPPEFGKLRMPGSHPEILV